MDQYCRIEREQHINTGSYYEAQITTHSGQPLHLELDFLSALADEMLRQYYGVSTMPELRMLRRTVLAASRDPAKLHKRLFNADLSPTDDFKTEASETLALWIERHIDCAHYAKKSGAPHNNTPAFDVVSVVRGDGHDSLRLVQVKASEFGLQAQCSHAVRRFVDADEHELGRRYYRNGEPAQPLIARR